jgi:hypothetical protein
VAEIPQAIRVQEQTDFLRDVLRLTGDITNEPDDEPDDDYDLGLSASGVELVHRILSLNDERLIQALVDLLDTDQRLLVAAIVDAPQFTLLYKGRGSFLRKLWRDLLPFKKFYSSYFDPINLSLRVIAFMMRNSLIPEEQRQEALKHIVDNLHEGYPHSDYSDEVLNDLTPFGFWEAVKQYGIGWGNSRWVALNLAISVEYLHRFPVDVHVARAFADLVPPETDFDDPYLHGSRFCEFEDCLDLRMGFFDTHPDKLDELVRIARENDIDISRFERLMREH